MRHLIAALAIVATITAGWLPASAQLLATVDPRQAAEAMGACLPGITIVPNNAFKREYRTVDVTTSDAPTYTVTDTTANPPTATKQTALFMVTLEREKGLATHTHQPDSLGVMLAFSQRRPGHEVTPQDQATVVAYYAKVIACFDQTYPWTGTAASIGSSAPTAGLWPGEQLVTVVRVVDGDTVDVRLADGKTERLRLIGIDTPETVDPRKPVQCFGKEASDRARTLLNGQQVSIIGDPSQDTRDRYGRLLSYIRFLDGKNFNYQMILEGYALEYTYQAAYYYQADFQAGQQAAKTQQLGLWSPTTCGGNTAQAAGAAPPATGGPDDVGSGAEVPTTTAAGPIPGLSPTPTPTPGPPPPPGGFNVANYINKGNAYNCSNFRSQADAQAVLRAAPSDPNQLDTDKDGIACETLSAPKDLQKVPR